MGTPVVRPETPEERLIYWTIVATWAIWLAGGLYVVGAAIGYVLLAILGARVLGLTGLGPARVHAPPVPVLVWVVGMALMAVALVAAHVDEELGLASMLKSMMGWLKGWALLAVLPLAGAMLQIRPALIYRATGLLAAQTLAMAPLLVAAEAAGLPATLYVSPLQGLLGVGTEFVDVSLYSFDEATGKTRWRFFAPWATAAAFSAGLGLVFALYERSMRWRIVGILATLVVCYMAGSRLSLVALPTVLVLMLALSSLTRPVAWMALGAIAFGLVLLLPEVIVAYEDATEAFNSARADSSRVRAALGNIAVHRWLTEAPVFGHGVLERGGHVVERMLVGSHHTWWGLLFVKGAVGFAGLAVPLAVSLVALVLRAQSDRVARAALGILLSMAVFSFGDNLEIIAYLIWPALLLLGIALRRPLRLPSGLAAA